MEEFAYGGKKHKLSEGFNDVAIYIGEHGAESGRTELRITSF